MSKFNLIPLIFLLTAITHFSHARTLTNPSPAPAPTPSHHYKHPKLKFLMQNIFNVSQKFPHRRANRFPTQIPFPKPRGYFPPKKGIPLPPSFESNNHNILGIPFLPKAAPQELEMGSVTEIEEHLFKTSYDDALLVVGKAQGMFVGSSDNGTGHMVAFTATFGDSLRDGLRFFGVYQRGLGESHIAVIGGTGKYDGANGYAAVRPVDAQSTANDPEDLTNELLLFNVYLS